VKPLTRMARLSAGFLTSNLVRGAIGFALSLAIARALGVERFGRWVLCTTWAAALTAVADLGLGLLLPRDGARCRDSGLGIRDSLGALCGSALLLRLTVALPAALATIAGASWFTVDAETRVGLSAAAVLGAVGAAYGCFGSTFRSQPSWVPSILVAETSWHAVQLGATVAVLWFVPTASVGALIAVAIIVQVLQTMTAVVMWRIAFPGEALIVPNAATVRGLLTRALPFAGTGVIANLQTRTAPLLLGYLATSSELGAFAAAAKFGTLARLAPGALFAGALPVLTHEHERRDGSSTDAFVSFDRACAVLAILSSIAIVLARPVLWRLYGPTFAAAAPALVWIGVGLAPALTNSAAKIALYAAGQERTAVAWSAVSLAWQAIAAVVLIPAFGAPGAAAAIALGEAVIWIPLRRARRARRTPTPSSRHRVPTPTFAPPRPPVADVPDPAAAR
jgi:O-antigen/teichoic acid export membrane protein